VVLNVGEIEGAILYVVGAIFVIFEIWEGDFSFEGAISAG